MDRIRFGAAYYAEYQHRPDLEADFDLMGKAGFSIIRVGESVWSTWEPDDGRFELNWLEPVLDAAHRHDIGVILGTPTYAIPMWLTRRYPEIAAETVSGHRVGWGARQEVNFAHAAYRFHAERVIRQVVGRYREHPAIIGYQIDNEPGLRLLYNADVFETFVDWLRRRYGTVDRLNEEWGLAYWSHRLSRWSDLWHPEGNFQPQYDLAWRRFQAELVTEFIGWQADIVRELTGGRGFVTTCISYEQPGIEDAELSRKLDVASGNAYYEMQDSLAHPSTLPSSSGPMGWVVRGPWAVTQLADLMYSSKQAPFLVTETNAGSIGFSAMNESPYDGQWRRWPGCSLPAGHGSSNTGSGTPCRPAPRRTGAAYSRTAASPAAPTTRSRGSARNCARAALPSRRPNPTTTSRCSTTPIASSRCRRRGRCGATPSSTPTPTGISSQASPAASSMPSGSSG